MQIKYILQNDLNHCLSTQNLRKIQIRSKLCELLFYGLKNSGVIIFSTAFGFFYVIAYTSQEYNYSLFIVLIWYYLKLRFKQIIQQLKHIRNKNLNYLMKIISIHNKLAIDTKNVNTFYSLITFEMRSKSIINFSNLWRISYLYTYFYHIYGTNLFHILIFSHLHYCSAFK